MQPALGENTDMGKTQGNLFNLIDQVLIVEVAVGEKTTGSGVVSGGSLKDCR